MKTKPTKKSERPLVTILVPVYNEERTIKVILEKVLKLPIDNYEVLVVNDASKDKSADIIDRVAKKHKSKHVALSVFTHPRNRGKGAGIKTGLKHAKGRYFVVQDADSEYEPKDIVKVLNAAVKDKRPVVYGSRFLGSIKNMPKPNYYANRFYNILLRVLYGVRMTDMHTCYKMVDTDLMQSLNMSANGFDYATELIGKLLKRKTPIYEVPISFNGRNKSQGKKINYKDGIDCTYKIISFRFTNRLSTESEFEKFMLLVRFGLVGVLGFVCNFTILKLINDYAGVALIPSEIIAAIVALNVTFVAHDQWTYKQFHAESKMKLPLYKRYFVYTASNAFSSVMTVVLFGLLNKALHRLPALALAALVSMVWNYFMNKLIIWRRRGVSND